MNLLQALALINEPNYTTQEQSKRLLNLGLPADSADCFYKRHLGNVNEYFEDPKLLPKGYNFSTWCGSTTGDVDMNICYRDFDTSKSDKPNDFTTSTDVCLIASSLSLCLHCRCIFCNKFSIF